MEQYKSQRLASGFGNHKYHGTRVNKRNSQFYSNKRHSLFSSIKDFTKFALFQNNSPTFKVFIKYIK